MHKDSCFLPANLRRGLTVVLFGCVFGVSVIHAQETTTPKRVLAFEGNKIFSNAELLEVANKCLAGWSGEQEAVEYCLYKVRQSMYAKGYLQAQLGKPVQEATDNGSRTIISVKEGPLFRLGAVEIVGSKVLAPSQIREMFERKTGDIAGEDSIAAWLYERVKKAYGNLGYIQYTAEIQPKFHSKDDALEGVVDLAVTIDEGSAFTIAAIKFVGNENVSRDALLREMTVRNGDIYSQDLFENGLQRLSQNGHFETIDADRDVDWSVDKQAPRVSLTIHLKKSVAGTAALTPQPRPLGQAIVIPAH
ncbi:MAG: outer membrane protein insertion porin family [Blastocatellia bacterium]|jgi:outer membrane protein insertion porin family|nr:outer membrane protein insertion porin family [Blastocatellia bacterium]